MVTKASAYDNPQIFFCNDSDTKPADVPNGSFLFEMDTTNSVVNIYLYEEDSTTWVPFSGS